MSKNIITIMTACVLIALSSCVSKKKFIALGDELANTQSKLTICQNKLDDCNRDKANVQRKVNEMQKEKSFIEKSNKEMISTLQAQISDLKKQRDVQYQQVGDLAVLNQSANENINQTIKQLNKKDKYIKYLLAAKTKADSLNLVISANIKSELASGIADNDIEVKVDKTVVFINISDKMLFKSGSYKINDRANSVLAKVAQIINSRPDLELMVEGYTDSQSIRNSCIEDNWDLSVKRSAAVVRALQKNFNIDPNRMIAAGRGEYNTLADNSTKEGRAQNRRTRIILLPKIDQFYDLLKPSDKL